MKRTATIILNRNLPEVTDRLYEHLMKYDKDVTDVFVVEAGSDPNCLSTHATWHANWPEAIEHGLRYQRGMNYGLSQLWKEKKFDCYDAFFLLTNDTEFREQPSILHLLKIMDQHPCIGILSPCSERWGELLLLKDKSTKYFWFIHNNAYLLRKEFVKSIINEDQPNHMHFLFDGSNFRGYGSDSELIAKSYANDWAAAITSEVFVDENESHLLNKSDLIKTERYEDNLRLYIEEGQKWMHQKYGFKSRWLMQLYVKAFYDHFFEFHPEYVDYKI